MQSGNHQLKKILVFLFMGTLIFGVDNGHAFEPWNAETTARVNLRKSPGLDGKIITRLAKGEIGLIKAKKGDWHQITLEYDTYGYKGWLFGKYLKRVDLKKKSVLYPYPQKGNHSKPVNEPAINTPPPQSRSPVNPQEKKQLRKVPEPLLETSSLANRNAGDKQNRLPRVNLSGNLNQDRQGNSFNWIVMIGSSMTLFCVTILFFFKTTRLTKTNQDLSTQLQRIRTKSEEKKASFKEKRRHPRKIRFAEVDFVVQDRAYWGSIRNVSAGGAYIETRDPFASGQKIVLTFPSPGSKEHMKKTGEILWTDASGIGVKFEAPKTSGIATPEKPVHL